MPLHVLCFFANKICLPNIRKKNFKNRNHRATLILYDTEMKQFSLFVQKAIIFPVCGHISLQKKSISHFLHPEFTFFWPNYSQISVVIPDTNTVPDHITNIFADSDHYILHNVRLSELIQRTFVEGFVNKGKSLTTELIHLLDPQVKNKFSTESGSFYGMTVDTRIDVDDCVAITPCKHLYLSLNKEVFQSLGLDGNVSFHSRKSQDRYSKCRHFKYFVSPLPPFTIWSLLLL